jgi:hypothetical protein
VFARHRRPRSGIEGLKNPATILAVSGDIVITVHAGKADAFLAGMVEALADHGVWVTVTPSGGGEPFTGRVVASGYDEDRDDPDWDVVVLQRMEHSEQSGCEPVGEPERVMFQALAV